MVAEQVTHKPIELFGFQRGPQGFVKRGTAERAELGLWQDRLWLLAHGGRASGKSAAGAYRAMNYLLAWAGSLGIATAPIFRNVWASTLPAFLKVLEEAGLRSGEHYQYVGKREEVEFCNGSRLMFMTTEHPEDLPGPSIAFLWMDECRRSPFEAYRLLSPCLRQEGYPHQGWLTTTPAGQGHWIHDLFYGGMEKPIGEYVGYPARTIENPHGGLQVALQIVSDYGGVVRERHVHAEDEECRKPWECYLFENLSPLTRQELNGEFVLAADLVYDCWDREALVVPESEWPTPPDKMVWVAAGVDFGFRNPAAILVEGMDQAGRSYVLEAFQRSRLSNEDLAQVAYKLYGKWGISRFLCDGSDPAAIATLRSVRYPGMGDFKLPAVAAEHGKGSVSHPESGIGLCYSALARRDDDRRPMFYVSPAAKAFIQNIENYVVAEGRMAHDLPERPREEHHDVMDAWRYVHTYLAKRYRRPPRMEPTTFDFAFGQPAMAVSRSGPYA